MCSQSACIIAVSLFLSLELRQDRSLLPPFEFVPSRLLPRDRGNKDITTTIFSLYTRYLVGSQSFPKTKSLQIKHSDPGSSSLPDGGPHVQEGARRCENHIVDVTKY